VGKEFGENLFSCSVRKAKIIFVQNRIKHFGGIGFLRVKIIRIGRGVKMLNTGKY